MTTKRKNPSLQKIGDLLAQAMGGARPAYLRKARQYVVWEQWAQIVGPHLAGKATPLRMQETTLILAAPSHAWVQELTFMVPDILQKIHHVVAPELVTAVRVVMRKPAE